MHAFFFSFFMYVHVQVDQKLRAARQRGADVMKKAVEDLSRRKQRNPARMPRQTCQHPFLLHCLLLSDAFFFEWVPLLLSRFPFLLPLPHSSSFARQQESPWLTEPTKLLQSTLQSLTAVSEKSSRSISMSIRAGTQTEERDVARREKRRRVLQTDAAADALATVSRFWAAASASCKHQERTEFDSKEIQYAACAMQPRSHPFSLKLFSPLSASHFHVECLLLPVCEGSMLAVHQKLKRCMDRTLPKRSQSIRFSSVHIYLAA